MPNANFPADGLLATTIANYKNTLADNVFESRVLLWILKSSGSIVNHDGGHEIVQQLMYAEAPNKGSYAEGDTSPLSVASANTGITAAQFPWRYYRGSVEFTNQELAKNSGRQQLLNLATARLQQLEMSMAQDINAMLFGDGTGNSNKDFYGLEIVIDDASTTFGGISRVSDTWWQSDVVTSATTLTEALLRTSYNNVSEGKDQPSIIVTTQAGYEAYEGLLQGTIRHEDTKMGDAGFDNLMFKSAPMAFDRDVAAGKFYFLNTKYVELATLAGVWFTPTDWMVPVDDDVKIKHLKCYANLVTSNPSRLGKLIGITNA